MPLIRPEIQNILRAAGLAPEATQSDTRPLSEKLDAAGLSLSETLEELASLARNSNNESLRAKVLTDIARMHGALKDTAPAPPSFTIVIQENSSLQSPESSVYPTSQQAAGVPSNVNPILLPRQLLNQLKSVEDKIN